MGEVILNKLTNYEGRTLYPGDKIVVSQRDEERWISNGIARYSINESFELSYKPLGKLKKCKPTNIIIPVHDCLDYLRICLNSIRKYTDNYKLIIIDNGSSPLTKKYLSESQIKHGFILITNKDNKGFSYACNQGIKVSTCDYMCFLNSDTLVSPGWLNKLMEGFKMPNAGIVGPSTCWCAGKQMMHHLRIKRMGITQEKVNRISKTLPNIISETEIYGFCYLVARKVIDKIGVFDEARYPIGSTEEKDFSWRAHKVGFKSYHVKNSYVHHFGGATFKELGIDGHAIRVKNDIAFTDRKRDPKIYIKNTAKIDNLIDCQFEPIPVLMIVLDRLGYTRKAIEAIFKNTVYPFKLFIFNNGSDAETTAYLESLDDNRIEIYHSKANIGLVPPMNMFFDKFKHCKYVAKVDNDTVVSPGWLTKLKSVMDKFPLFTVEANHYLAMPFKIEANDDFYRHLFGTEFEGAMLYFYQNSGGTGQLIRTSIIDEPVPEAKGSLSGWVRYQVERYRKYPSAFYLGTWIDRLDQVDTNKYKAVSDYPQYDNMIRKMRPGGLGRSDIKNNIGQINKIRREMEIWYSGL